MSVHGAWGGTPGAACRRPALSHVIAFIAASGRSSRQGRKGRKGMKTSIFAGNQVAEGARVGASLESSPFHPLRPLRPLREACSGPVASEQSARSFAWCPHATETPHRSHLLQHVVSRDVVEFLGSTRAPRVGLGALAETLVDCSSPQAPLPVITPGREYLCTEHGVGRPAPRAEGPRFPMSSPSLRPPGEAHAKGAKAAKEWKLPFLLETKVAEGAGVGASLESSPFHPLRPLRPLREACSGKRESARSSVWSLVPPEPVAAGIGDQAFARPTFRITIPVGGRMGVVPDLWLTLPPVAGFCPSLIVGGVTPTLPPSRQQRVRPSGLGETHGSVYCVISDNIFWQPIPAQWIIQIPVCGDTQVPADSDVRLSDITAPIARTANGTNASTTGYGVAIITALSI